MCARDTSISRRQAIGPRHKEIDWEVRVMDGNQWRAFSFGALPFWICGGVGTQRGERDATALGRIQEKIIRRTGHDTQRSPPSAPSSALQLRMRAHDSLQDIQKSRIEVAKANCLSQKKYSARGVPRPLEPLSSSPTALEALRWLRFVIVVFHLPVPSHRLGFALVRDRVLVLLWLWRLRWESYPKSHCRRRLSARSPCVLSQSLYKLGALSRVRHRHLGCCGCRPSPKFPWCLRQSPEAPKSRSRRRHRIHSFSNSLAAASFVSGSRRFRNHTTPPVRYLAALGAGNDRLSHGAVEVCASSDIAWPSLWDQQPYQPDSTLCVVPNAASTTVILRQVRQSGGCFLDWIRQFPTPLDCLPGSHANPNTPPAGSSFYGLHSAHITSLKISQSGHVQTADHA
ncbi:hypothetical protein MAPG_03503 [Magnaporthiopsis poae ATCC 64411]|uniref:Uncharacterized protein n=1 Tax=Magnaporthiopsis poae (strain ATCC 64411 / 73-15) TaxID=644358 RepID=A0A0C4DU68_MAGP6|nr:hypothetical protein MAPG_03503 [Magnaporthiopsis poae ATCC 64411]